MKNIRFRKSLIVGFAGLLLIYACGKHYLKVPLPGASDASALANKAGVEGLLIGAYSLLDGIGAIGNGGGEPGLTDGSGGIWETSADNWVYGSVAGGDDHKGSDPGDQPDIVPIQSYSETSADLFFNDKWLEMYGAIQRCNDVLREMRLVKDGSMTAADTLEAAAEARFLRALYNMEAKKMWNNIPWVDESVTYGNGNYNVPNTVDVWPMIEADLNFAITNLPATQSSIGRVNSWAAKAFLAKALVFEQKFPAAYTILQDIIANGVTAGGTKYALLPKFGDNFNAANKNSSESIFASQSSVDALSAGGNGNAGDVLNFPYGGPSTCCGFYQPSYSLVNSFKVDPTTGLPLVTTYNNDDLKNDEGLAAWAGTAPDTFVPDARPVDPRLDWSTGRRGIPYLDWGLDPGASWVRNQASAGPYLPIKYIVTAAQAGKLSTQYGGWAVNQATADNYVYIRFADVLLWAAECAAQTNDLTSAVTYVNQVRTRAANPAGFVYLYKKNALGIPDPTLGPDVIPAANYKCGLYASFPDQATALTDIYFERKLELSSEGHRFFDLVRWGIADVELNAYIAHEANFDNYLLLKPGGAVSVFTKGKNEYYPIPQAQIDASTVTGKATLTQNPGY
jgi:hypothetical protein